ncbi:hypothetical protein [Streptomyces sp. NPDC059786]|uniref:hypothetical protein n=1 Tax=Streptomyces sp. NPDC059786 TaxID=3346946 RepID=UPI00364E18D5
MIRIIRTTTLRNLQDEAASLTGARQEAADHAAHAEHWRTEADEYKTGFDNVMKQLGQAHADTAKAERERNEISTQWMQEKAATNRELVELRKEYQRIRAAADNPQTDKFQAAVALDVLRELYNNARQHGLDTRTLDIVAFVCGFAPTGQPRTDAATTADEALLDAAD